MKVIRMQVPIKEKVKISNVTLWHICRRGKSPNGIAWLIVHVLWEQDIWSQDSSRDIITKNNLKKTFSFTLLWDIIKLFQSLSHPKLPHHQNFIMDQSWTTKVQFPKVLTTKI